MDQHRTDPKQRMRLVYTGEVGQPGDAALERTDEERRAAQRRVIQVALGALGLGVLLVYLMSLGGSAADRAGPRSKRGPVFGYVLDEARGPGVTR
ncbi:hypothetical protein N9Z54_06240 [Planctomycetota bacterium]|jgi:hypothetical protein|nr:hypothetical protein [Planctomycetota bacterium]